MRSKVAKALWKRIRDSSVSPHEVDKKYKQAKKDHVRDRGRQFPKLKQSRRQQRIANAKSS